MRKIQGEECHGAHSPNLELKLLLDPSPIPDPCLAVSQEKKEPQTITAYAFIQRTKPVMMYTDDAKIASPNIVRHHSPRAQEQLVGNEWWETRYTCKPRAYEDLPTKRKS